MSEIIKLKTQTGYVYMPLSSIQCIGFNASISPNYCLNLTATGGNCWSSQRIYTTKEDAMMKAERLARLLWVAIFPATTALQIEMAFNDQEGK